MSVNVDLIAEDVLDEVRHAQSQQSANETAAVITSPAPTHGKVRPSSSFGKGSDNASCSATQAECRYLLENLSDDWGRSEVSSKARSFLGMLGDVVHIARRQRLGLPSRKQYKYLAWHSLEMLSS